MCLYQQLAFCYEIIQDIVMRVCVCGGGRGSVRGVYLDSRMKQ